DYYCETWDDSLSAGLF
nr:immunoglobulin light chain junction region [Macaca mulatta]MOW67155.1 immunoglobulin light chain junction region [Macaca mulatta]MOW67877.1 immunoglobulin light chain junction region [Macaca mulatta]MOW68889.1 immunoglobulin light chain junction region [Macaca mulatta]MOW70492.1 immunoglobulin light chain junction region [Macaca mulatta]